MRGVYIVSSSPWLLWCGDLSAGAERQGGRLSRQQRMRACARDVREESRMTPGFLPEVVWMGTIRERDCTRRLR